MVRRSVAREDHVISLKVMVTIQTYAMRIHYDKNVFVSYSYPRFYSKMNFSHFDLYCPFLPLLYYKSLFYGPLIIKKASTLIKVLSYSRH